MYCESPVPPIDIPSVTLPRFIRQRARELSEAVAIVEGLSGETLRYAELDRYIGRCAAALAVGGLKPGDRLLLYAPNLPAWPVVALAALAAGGVVTGANPGLGVDELAHQMRSARPRFVATVAAYRDTAQQAIAKAGTARLIMLDEDESADALLYEQMLSGTHPEPALAEDPDALAALPFSSGTSGEQKGVMLTHRAMVANILQYNRTRALEDPAGGKQEVVLAFLPMSHIFGFVVITLCGLAAGRRIVTLPRFEPETFLRALQDHRVTHLSVVPPILHFLATHPLVARFDLSSLQSIRSGAAPLDSKLERQAAERLGCEILQGYGMTEASGVIATAFEGRRRAGSSGQLLPGTQARVVEPVSGMDVAPGLSGEIWFRGPQAFKGYQDKPDETAATLMPDGWVRTGDIGYIDADGFVFLTDRLKELIKVQGFQVAPAELEALLLNHGAVADAAVIGRPDERYGEIPVAYVVLQKELDRDSLIQWVAQRVAKHKQLHEVVLCEFIPRTTSGKILRRSLREKDAQITGRTRPAAAT